MFSFHNFTSSCVPSSSPVHILHISISQPQLQCRQVLFAFRSSQFSCVSKCKKSFLFHSVWMQWSPTTELSIEAGLHDYMLLLYRYVCYVYTYRMIPRFSNSKQISNENAKREEEKSVPPSENGENSRSIQNYNINKKEVSMYSMEGNTGWQGNKCNQMTMHVMLLLLLLLLN